MSNSLRPHESQHGRPPCPSPTPGVYSNSCPLSQWCHPAISSSVIPFSSCPQSLLASGSFPMSQLFTWGGQSTDFSFSISPSNEHPGLISLRMDWLDLLAVQGTLKSLLQHHNSKASVSHTVSIKTWMQNQWAQPSPDPYALWPPWLHQDQCEIQRLFSKERGLHDLETVDMTEFWGNHINTCTPA